MTNSTVVKAVAEPRITLLKPIIMAHCDDVFQLTNRQTDRQTQTIGKT